MSYLGGHKYTTAIPISQNATTQGTRMFLNPLFDSTCATQEGAPNITLTKTAPTSTTDPTLTFTVSDANAGPSVALEAILTDTLPVGAAFVSATNGGTEAGGVAGGATATGGAAPSEPGGCACRAAGPLSDERAVRLFAAALTSATLRRRRHGRGRAEH